MASYLVVEPETETGDAAEKAVVLRDGFSFFAFLAPVIWFLVHRMWWEALAALALALALAALGTVAGYSAAAFIVSLCVSFLIGMEAQSWRVASLQRRGWHVWGVVEANSKDEAEIRYAAESASGPQYVRTSQRPAAAPPPVPWGSAGNPVAQRRHSTFGLIDYPRKS
ncbi:DUF2628 domain-containing protein [Nitratireductor thuwali]|uniref:DUF2628 domain-containing protein n=1 Tax=Nitratireductor thuwali TaxID=2267699 RepID=A0ABY5MHX3_9HYPH|nr:hypothetical protein NTH_02065 [Nitratireductor thuwali]